MNSLNEIMDVPSLKKQPQLQQMEKIAFNHNNICNKTSNKSDNQTEHPQESHRQDPQKAQEAVGEVVTARTSTIKLASCTVLLLIVVSPTTIKSSTRLARRSTA